MKFLLFIIKMRLFAEWSFWCNALRMHRECVRKIQISVAQYLIERKDISRAKEKNK